MKTTGKQKKPIVSELRIIAVPAMIGFLFSTLFNVVDSFYAGRIGTDAIAGMTLAFPVFMILLSLAAGMGNGINALAAIAIGENDQRKFLSLFKNALVLVIVLGIAVPLIAPFLADFIFTLQGAEADAHNYAMRYIVTVMVGFLFFMLNFIFNGVLYAQGNSKPFRNFLIVASIVNIVLNPLFIFGFWMIPALDTAGIAVATVMVQMGGSVYLFHKARSSQWVRLSRLAKVPYSKQSLSELLRQGIPSALNNATIALGIFVINFYVQLYGGTHTLAAYGIAIRIEQLVLVPTLGLNVAVITLVGRSFGAQDISRIYAVWKKATIAGLIIMASGLLVIVPFAPFFITIFDDTPRVVEAGTRYLRIEALAFLSYVILNIGVSLLQGVKKPGFAFWIGSFRQLLPFGLFYLLGTILAMGIDGVWWGIVIINWSAVAITLVYAKKVMRTLEQRFHVDQKTLPQAAYTQLPD